jgi:hypothetical protein
MAWKKASMAVALGYHPGGTRARLCFHLQQDAYDTDSLIGVLEQLAGFYRGQRVVLLWDGLSSHWSYKMRTHLDTQRDWLTVERLPAYAPELNPVEFLWWRARVRSSKEASVGLAAPNPTDDACASCTPAHTARITYPSSRCPLSPPTGPQKTEESP